MVGYPEDGILAGILPGNAKMLHGDGGERIAFTLVNPLSDVKYDLDATKSFLDISVRRYPERKREVYCVFEFLAVADADAKDNLKKAAKGAFDGILSYQNPSWLHWV